MDGEPYWSDGGRADLQLTEEREREREKGGGAFVLSAGGK